MKRSCSIFVVFAVVVALSSLTFAQYVITDDDNPAGNSGTVYKLSSTGALTQVKVLSTGGTGLGGGYFGTTGSTVAQNAACVFIMDTGSNDIAAFSKTTGYSKVGNYSNAAVNTSLFGIGGSIALAPNAKYLYGGYSGSENVGAWKVNSDCSLTFINAYTPSGGADYFSPLRVTPNSLGLVVPLPDLQEVELFKINSDGSLTDAGFTSFASVGGCATTGCFPTGVDISKDSKVAFFGNATTANASVLTASIGPSGISNPAEWIMSDSCGVLNDNDPWLSPGAYATGTGNLYLGASGFGSGYPSGVITASYTESPLNITEMGCTGITSPSGYDGDVRTALNTATGTGLVVAEWFNTLGVFGINSNGTLKNLSTTMDTQANGALSISVYPSSH